MEVSIKSSGMDVSLREMDDSGSIPTFHDHFLVYAAFGVQ